MSMLNKLMNNVKATEQKTTTKKNEKPVITLTGTQADICDAFTGSDAILKVAKSTQEATKAQATEVIKDEYFRMCIERGYKVENPAVTSANSKANFQAKHQSKLKRTPAPDGKMLTVGEQLQQLGFSDDVIEIINRDVIEEKPSLGLKKFTDLISDESTPQQRAVAEKLMALVDAHLTPDEQALVLEHTIETKVRECWKDMAVNLACRVGGGDVDAGVDALSKLYSVLPPTFVMSQMAYSGEISKAFENLQTPPPPTKQILESPNAKYIAVCEGSACTLYMVKPDGNEKVNGKTASKIGTKSCANANHAEASARKWFRNADDLNEAIIEFSKKS